MNKIGIKITKISAGVQDMETVNEGNWVRKVVDIRPNIKSLSGVAMNEGEPFLMLSYLREGALLTISHTIPGRSGDLVSAWLFIPAEIAISAEEELAVIEQVKQEISKTNVENWDFLEQLFSKEYPLKQRHFPYSESSQTNPEAVRYYGAGTDFELRELLGEKIYQRYFAEHRFVFLLEKNSGIIADDKLVNYTDEPLREIVFVDPPQMPAGVSAKFNDSAFDKPILAYKGDKATLTFLRSGFKAVAYTISLGGPMPDATDLPWQKIVTTALFQVTDNEGQDRSASSRIRINGQTLTPNGLFIPEMDCKAVNVEVDCPDCEPYRNTFNLLAQPAKIVLEKEKQDILYILDGKECPELTECPKGYTFTESRKGKTTYRFCTFQEPDAGPNWKTLAIIGTVAALLIGLCLGFFTHKFITGHNDKKENQTKQEITAPKENNENPKREETAKQVSAPTVYACLNQNTWKKSELEKEQDLAGLFDDLTRGKMDRLTGTWAAKIDRQQHSYWDKLLKKIESHDPEQLKGFQFDNKATEISIEYYMACLEKYILQNMQKKNTASTPSAGTGRASNPNNNGKKKNDSQDNQEDN